MSRTQEFYDKTVRNDHYVEDYKQNVADGYEFEYDRFLRRVSRIIQAEFGRRITVARQREINREIEDELDVFLERLESLSADELLQFQEVFHDSLSQALTDIDSSLEPPEFRPTRGYMSKPHAIDKGDVISVEEMIASAGAVLRRDLTSIITRMSIMEEDTETLGTYYEVATNKTRNNLRTAAVTGVALMAGFTRSNFFNRSRDIVGHQHISVLDAATTDICQFRHSKVWYYLDSLSDQSTLPDSSVPPLHRNCRSETIPIFRGDGPLPEESYEEWFERQDDAMKREVLGERRYELYQKEDLSISQFTDRTGDRLTLAELRERIN